MGAQLTDDAENLDRVRRALTGLLDSIDGRRPSDGEEFFLEGSRVKRYNPPGCIYPATSYGHYYVDDKHSATEGPCILVGLHKDKHLDLAECAEVAALFKGAYNVGFVGGEHISWRY